MLRSNRHGLPALLVAVVALFSGAAALAEEGAQALGKEQRDVLYALGVAFGYPVKQFVLSPAEFEVLTQGFRDAALGRPLKADPYEFQDEMNALSQERVVVRIEQERAASLTFVANAAREEGAVQTPSGLVIRELVAGTGPTPQITSAVKVHYHGTLRGGMVFDSTVLRDAPATFQLERVIACWQEGLQRMKVGGRSQLVCPASTAYGEEGAPPLIPPAAALVFEVELLELVE